MTQQTLIESQTVDLAETPSRPASHLEDLLGRLADTLEEQSWLRVAGGRWNELAAVQSTLHELRAALAIERRRVAARPPSLHQLITSNSVT